MCLGLYQKRRNRNLPVHSHNEEIIVIKQARAFTRNSKNNSRIKKTSIKLISELMDIEDKFIIEVKKIAKTKTDKKH